MTKCRANHVGDLLFGVIFGALFAAKLEAIATHVVDSRVFH